MKHPFLVIILYFTSVVYYAQVGTNILMDADTVAVPVSGKAGKSEKSVNIEEQKKDSLTRKEKRELLQAGKIKRPKKPWKAAVMSACLPGLGQMYNEKWWKVPIVWGGLGAVGYFMIDSHIKFIDFRDAYRNRVNGIATPYDGIYTDQGLVAQRDSYRRNRDLLIIIGTAVWVLNIVDATVDAHLSSFDVSKDLSMKIRPSSQLVPELSTPYFGISFSFQFKSKTTKTYNTYANRSLGIW
ncbi:MAG: DUF5683 domain-containing protein [Flavobacteriales bacterium]|nr:DUF5683 domain-containing protein [Flavobacteriales bacterium]